jgi:hypothetical protein
MHSTLDGRNDPHDVLEIAPDVVLVARAAAEFPSLAPDATHRPLDRQPNMGSGSPAGEAIPRVDTSFRATDTSGGRSHGAWARRAAVVFLFALGSAFAAAAWERYGDDAQASVAGITPQIIPALMSWLPLQKPATAAQADSAPVTRNAASTDQTAPSIAAQPADSAIAAAPAAAASSAPDQAEALQSMARHVANLTQQVSELQASIVQLKANQEQMARDKAKAPEARVSEVRPAAPAEPRPTRLGAPPRPLGTLVHRSRPPTYPPAQTAYVPPPPSTAAPAQIAPPPPVAAQPDGDPVVRPPMPVR